MTEPAPDGTPDVSLTGGQGIQVGDRNVQHNTYYVQARQDGVPVFTPEQSLPAEYPPSALLRGDYEIVPFAGRATELEQLTEWCQQDKRVAVALVIGPGGQGKTRLARQLRHRMSGHGWAAGFLHDDVHPGGVRQLTERGASCLLIIDYAETRARQIAAIGSVIARAARNPVRILLLARAAGDWWTKLYDDTDDDQLAALLDNAAMIDLGPVSHATADRIASFESAYREFAARLGLGHEPVIPPPDLDDNRYDLLLTVHMAALAALLDSSMPLGGADRADARSGSRDPARRVLAHERRYWKQARAARSLPDAIDAVALGQIVAAATLFGAPDTAAALRLLRSLPAFADQPQAVLVECLRWASAVHPGPSALNPLQPDRLGEDHVTAVLGDTGPDLIGAALPQCDDGQRRRALTVLGRAASRHESAGSFIEDMMIGDPGRLVPIAAEVATQLRDPDPLTSAIAACLPRLTDQRAIFRLADALPGDTVALADTAVAITRVAVAASAEVNGEDSAEHAVRLNDLAARLAAVDAHEEALETAQRAVAVARLAGSASLAAILCTLARQQAMLGLTAEARGSYREAMTLSERDDEHLYAVCLSSYALLGGDGRKPNILADSAKAVRILQRLARDKPADQQRDYAMAIANDAAVLTVDGHYNKALDGARRALSVLRPLAALRPDAFRPDLGRVLNSLAAVHAEVGHFAQARSPATEAAQIFRDLAALKPGRFDVLLTDVLRTYAGVLSALGQGELAFDTMAQTVAIFQKLIARRPAARLPDFVTVMHNLPSVATRANRGDDALEILRGTEAQLRQLPPGGARDDALGVTLSAISNVQYHECRYDLAAAAGAEAAAILLPGIRGDLYGAALANRAMAQARLGNITDAVEGARTAATVARSLDPAFEIGKLDVARGLGQVTVALLAADRTEYAAAIGGHAVELSRAVAARNPAYVCDLGVALRDYAVALYRVSPTLNRHRWGAAIEEAIGLLQPLADRSAGARQDLAKAVSFREAAIEQQAQTWAEWSEWIGSPPAAGAGSQSAGRRSRRDRLGPNDPCPCGSGRKHKHCCGAPPGRRPSR
jgi:tetratricopeptide (TPR) repeat protein